MRYSKYFISIILFLTLAASSIWANPTVQLLSQRHRTEWNWVEYRISLTNKSSEPIRNPEIHYYAADPAIIATIDPISDRYSITSTSTPVGNMSDIKLSVVGTLNPRSKIEIHFRIHKKGWDAYDFSKDWSHQKNMNETEPNYFMAVYDSSHKILWGDDPINGNHNTSDVLTWNDRGVNTVVTKYNGNKNDILPAGRFWLFKDTPLSPKERDLLAQRGISKLSIGKTRGKIVGAFKTSDKLKKKTLDSLIAGFYNAIPVADTKPIKVYLTDEDLNTEKDVCYADGRCNKIIEPRTEFEVDISCWEDVDVNECISTISRCKGKNIGVARGFLVATVAKDSLQCLAKKRNIESLNVVRTPALSNDKGREAVNISSLQNSEEWLNALKKDSADFDWLKGVEYSGDSILVGVYDTSTDFDHPDFNEYDSLGEAHPRIMQKHEYFGIYYDSSLSTLKRTIKAKEFGNAKLFNQFHGTVVSGYIGGNGNMSATTHPFLKPQNFKYRGVAPKVHFYHGDNNAITQQIGHVVNHSHTIDMGWYQQKDYEIDEAIFKNWKSGCSKTDPSKCIEGDTLVKTAIFSAHNNGRDKKLYCCSQGFHSIFANAKNPIIVGNITAEEKIRATTSSMGPTMDGRIKPDVMAPGISSQLVVDEAHPFEVQIDFIKLYRANETTPYLNIEFNKKDSSTLSNYATSCNIIPLEGNNNVLDCKASDLDSVAMSKRLELYFIKILENKITISPTDSVEIRYKIIKGLENSESIFGSVFFGKADTKLTSETHFIWSLPKEFQTERFGMINVKKNDEISLLRVDFDFTRGTITPDICYGNSCGYKIMGDGGTSQAAPFVSGVAALMYQKFHKQTGDPLDKHSMRNSTTKALLIHTAVDMEDSEEAHFASNPDLNRAHNDGKPHFTPYGKGPDFATGWGYINGKAALDMISDYNKKTKEFPKFKEIEIGNGIEKRWIINVDTTRSRLRTTLVWDDAPGYLEATAEYYISQNSKEPKLVNNLDMYLISPSGKYYYPWRLKPLPTEILDSLTSGLENILESDVDTAQNNCTAQNKLSHDCFDSLNNVEVVDVENPELGKWQIVIFGRSVTEFNNDSSNAQVATLVSDFSINEGHKSSAYDNCKVTNGYAPQTDYSCTYEFGKDVVYYVTFHDSTAVGSGDDIILTDAEGKNIGMYVGKELAGKTIKVKSSKLTVTLHSDNDKSQGWGFDVTRIRSINQAILKMPFEAIKKKRRIP